MSSLYFCLHLVIRKQSKFSFPRSIFVRETPNFKIYSPVAKLKLLSVANLSSVNQMFKPALLNSFLVLIVVITKCYSDSCLVERF